MGSAGNTLLLSVVIHHATFAHFLLGVTPDGLIEMRSDLLSEKDGPMLQHGLHGLHEKRIHRLRNAADDPDPDRLELRYQKYRQAS